jgi:hypothetical protein
MKQLTKQEYQKRALLIQKLIFLLELNTKESVAAILSYLISPIGQEVHPYRWTDNQLLGAIEKEIYNIENGIDDDE